MAPMLNFSQNGFPKAQPLMIMCSGVSSFSLQISHVLLWRTCFFCRTIRHWIRFLRSSHMNSCTLFFWKHVSVFLDKENVQVWVQIQRHTVRIQEQLCQPNYAKNPERKNYNLILRSLANQRSPESPSPSPITAKGEDARRHHELEKAHRPQAFVGVEEDTQLGRWDDANGGHTSTGVTPHPVQLTTKNLGLHDKGQLSC